ncbi:bifunctional UDP-N-acetylglucosamine diphosphorylase/glucosamine-1-phosphate N-acetyltransferase GlmU [Galbitalea sp. SE-J8]|uniref:bifunctional UDP-N-acetylglucosamine diphosphorylase/glucosamine-1-phosphate N-acetyltransferase GlmU n=1 Tax=Galbitalea sp. SE-J8 TaxID=3054952 RepID=UPI00259D1DFE|nr:bifunctional UDP-N-acetylglucosamine diphosphorylase/glucosamine-1-phosphate N-acetyltransferase GlmU [Galbitalea sp. SE-J8]MDM4762804.1 bifunctional UDP-N-acetylglucosamine diphosphorylase/glucosamine-1-phosphate N-acetyltransferase GlmU [Galbitalea sp. SE-J8]
MTELGTPDPRLAVIVLAAGQGTRMRSATPKVLHDLAGLPLVGHVLATARALGPAVVAVVVRHERDLVAEAVATLDPDAVIVDQDDVPGTGRAAELALAALPEDFAGDVVVISADVPLLDADTLRGLIARHRADAAGATILSAVLDDATGYGRIVRDAAGAVDRIVEQKDATDAERAIHEVNSGSYVFDATGLRQLLPGIGTDNAQREKYLTDVVAAFRASGSPVAALPVPAPWIVAGVNDRAQLSEVARQLNALIVRGWQVAGVTVQDPATTWIDRTVTLAEDVTILPGSQLRGATSVERGATIGPDTTLVDTEVGERATVKRVDANLAVVGAGASVGPWAYLRPGTRIGEGGHVGTFVETKNAVIGAGSKVPHLSYIGDAEIGADVNIAAGAITANYDDLAKHRTVIGDHVHTGAQNVFVAPVTVGAGAKIGAGALIRKDVPPGALALSAGPQRHMMGWVEEHRPGTAAAEAARAADHD